MTYILLTYAAWAALIMHIGMVLVCVWRVWRGENIIDRLIGLDVSATLVIAILVLISVLEKNSFYIDIAIGLAALGAISSIALAKYIADERMF
jgi:multisubunit Na+/H+ antiporter MnhF subunit